MFSPAVQNTSIGFSETKIRLPATHTLPVLIFPA